MTDSDPRGSGELTDAQLDQLLAETNRELLENVEALSDPSRTLTAIMSRSARQARASRRATHGLGQALAATMRSRIRARAVARILADAYRLNSSDDHPVGVDHQALTLARDRARELAGELARDIARDRARDIAVLLRRDLDHAIELTRELDRALERARDIAALLTSARHNALALALALDERQVDVSGADLSRMDINPDLLNGAIWTHETSWPPGVATQVRTHSTEIRPDVYQVRLGNTLERDFLALS